MIPSRRRLLIVLGTILVLATAAGLTIGITTTTPAMRVEAQFAKGVPEPDGAPVLLDTTMYMPQHTPAPAVLLAHGFGGTKRDLDAAARKLAGSGYVVLAYTARGFGVSGGKIHLDAPAYEVADASKLVDLLASRRDVIQDGPNDPRVAVAGASYGGGLALLLAGHDKRIDAVAADISWNSLTHALFPNAGGTEPGVFKKLWAGVLFQAGIPGAKQRPGATTAPQVPDASGCGRFAPDLCAAYQEAAQTGRPTATMLSLLAASSPATILDQIKAPTLLSQGEQDSLFPLAEADANARGIAANGTPVRVVWRSGGHDGGNSGNTLDSLATSWFDLSLHGAKPSGAQPFEVAERGAALSASSGNVISQTLRVNGGYPFNGARKRSVPLSGSKQLINAPAGGNPSAITALPQIGGLLSDAAQLSGNGRLDGLSAIPGQVASFESAPLTDRLLMLGASTATLSVTSAKATDATLFVAVHDIDSDGGDVLPSSLVAPIRITGLHPGVAKSVTVRLPSVAHEVPSGHRLRLTVSTTDLAYFLPSDPRSYTVALRSPDILAPTATTKVLRAGNPITWLIVGLGSMLAALAVGMGSALRRRRTGTFDPNLVDVPISITDLAKEYRDGYRAVDGVTFRVERGQVVGLLGPNGAGKTTTLRVLVGLILPTSGKVHVFGHQIVPGAEVLSRIGAFIEGPGFLPHLSGRENLRLFWAATGRPTAVADFETALQIAGLGSSIDRKVSTYSQGMKQRLGIAQAMLGLPELLVLDEPTNGLDPPQIAEMREVLHRYAATGRTVVVSSHLLAEVEQTCTHIVVMHNGRLIVAGSVSDVVGQGGIQLAVDDPSRAAEVLAAAGIASHAVPAGRALEDVFLSLVEDDQ